MPIPANGAITIATKPGTPVTVSVGDSQYIEVPGTLVLIADGMWAWHAASLPLPGLYTVEVIDEFGSVDNVEIELIEPTERTWPELTSAASLTQVTTNDAPSCCTFDTGAGVIDFSCVTLSETTYAVLHPGLSSSSSPIELNQYLFRYAAPDHGSEIVVLPWTTAAELPIYEMSDEYCYEVAAIDLVTGTIHPYRDLPSRCAPHGRLAPIASTVKQLADDALWSTICPMPPHGFGTRWCELNAEACLVDVPPRHCHYYPYTCDNQPYPGPGWRSGPPSSRGSLDGLFDLIDDINERNGGEGATDAGADLEGEDDVEDAGGADAAAEPTAVVGTVGCTVLRPGQADLRHMLLGFLAACVWRVSRRREH